MIRSQVTGRRISIPDGRPPDQIREHYELEKRLAWPLRNSSSSELRKALYTRAYKELYSSLPHHPMMSRSTSPAQRLAHARPLLRTLRPYLQRASVFLEIGAGDCGVTREAARLPNIARAYAVDVTDEQLDRTEWPANLEFVAFDGFRSRLPNGACDLAFSNQVIEHLHPADEHSHLQEVYRLLSPGGRYVCVVPNRISGPHDISQHFDDLATGFHLNEVTMGHLTAALKTAGFARVRAILRVADWVREYPPMLTTTLEATLRRMPHSLAHAVGHTIPGQKLCLVNVTLVGTRP